MPASTTRPVHPDITRGVPELFKAIHRGGVPQQVLELVHLRASQINGCSACTDVGSGNAIKAGIPVEKLLTLPAWHEDPRFDEASGRPRPHGGHDRLADRPGAVTERHGADAAKHYTETQLASLVLMVSSPTSSTASTRPSGGGRRRWAEEALMPFVEGLHGA